MLRERVKFGTGDVGIQRCAVAQSSLHPRFRLAAQFFFGGAHQAEQQLHVALVRQRQVVFFHDVAEQAVVEIVAAQCGIAARRLHFKQAFGQLQHGYVKRAAAQVVHHECAFGRVVQTVGNGGGGGFVQQAQHVDAGQPRRVFGGLALRVVEISGDGDDRAHQFAAQRLFGARFQAGQNVGGYVNRRFDTVFGVQFDDFFRLAEAVGQVRRVDFGQCAANQAFGGGDGVLRVGFLCGQRFFADHGFAVAQIAHHGGQRGVAVFVCQTHGGTAFHAGDQAVGGAQVNAGRQTVLVRRGRHIGFGNLEECHGVCPLNGCIGGILA